MKKSKEFYSSFFLSKIERKNTIKKHYKKKKIKITANY